MKKSSPKLYRFIVSLVVLGGICVLFLLGRFFVTDSTRYVFLLWNLVLASLAPLVALWLVTRVRQFGWLRWQQLLLTFLWIIVLPNSFYLITDLVHLRPNYEASVIYDTVLLQSFVIAGLALGYTSLILVHREIEKRFTPRATWLLISGILLATSFAIYLGRFSRWNSWDLLLRPAGLLFDVSDRFVNPGEHSDTYLTTATFFVLLLTTYIVIWEARRLNSGRG